MKMTQLPQNVFDQGASPIETMVGLARLGWE